MLANPFNWRVRWPWSARVPLFSLGPKVPRSPCGHSGRLLTHYRQREVRNPIYRYRKIHIDYRSKFSYRFYIDCIDNLRQHYLKHTCKVLNLKVLKFQSCIDVLSFSVCVTILCGFSDVVFKFHSKYLTYVMVTSLEHHGVSNHWQLDSLLNSILKLTSKKTSKLCITGCVWGESMGNSLQWHHKGRDSVSNRQPHDSLLNRLFRRWSKKTSNLCVGNSPGTMWCNKNVMEFSSCATMLVCKYAGYCVTKYNGMFHTTSRTSMMTGSPIYSLYVYMVCMYVT